jgi:haloalkane dehalogenase
LIEILKAQTATWLVVVLEIIKGDMQMMRTISLLFGSCLLSMACLAASAPDPRDGVFGVELPYESKYVTIKNHQMHYVDHGEGQVFLFLHGNPTSSYLWRNVMPYVEPLGRVIAVDNIGFGKSAKPDLDYTFQTHYPYLESFIDELGLSNIVLVIHDWGSALGLEYARRHADNVKGVVFMEAIIPPAFPMADLTALGGSQGMFAKFRTPEVGEQLLIEQNVFIEQILLNGTLTRQMSDAEKDAYRAPFEDPASRFPIYVWPNELPIAGKPARNVDLVNGIGEWLKTSPTPKLLQYASPGAIISPDAASWMAENYRNIETQFVGYGAHYIQEDNPQAIGRGIVDWYRRQFQKPIELSAISKEVQKVSDSKVYMMNALWFKEGGAQAYAEYGEAAGPIVAALGGKRLDGFVPTQSLIGDWQPDLFFIVEWPNWEAFVALGQSEAYQKIAHLREIGLENSLLIRCDRLP